PSGSPCPWQWTPCRNLRPTRSSSPLAPVPRASREAQSETAARMGQVLLRCCDDRAHVAQLYVLRSESCAQNDPCHRVTRVRSRSVHIRAMTPSFRMNSSLHEFRERILTYCGMWTRMRPTSVDADIRRWTGCLDFSRWRSRVRIPSGITVMSSLRLLRVCQTPRRSRLRHDGSVTDCRLKPAA